MHSHVVCDLLASLARLLGQRVGAGIWDPGGS